MEVLPSLLPPSYTGKSEPTAKDSRRQQQGNNNASKHDDAENSMKDSTRDVVNEMSEIERRVGEDRRRKRTNRGRWLESRDRNDRRATDLAVFVKI